MIGLLAKLRFKNGAAVAVTERRQRFVNALNRMDASWMTFLEDEAFYDINFSDLFTGLWLAEQPVRKLDAVKMLRYVGPQTAAKYVEKAIDKGYIDVVPDPSDGRAKLLNLSPAMATKLERFFDTAIKDFRVAIEG